MRPVAVACCDLDVGVAQGVLPMPPGHAVGHEGIAEVVAVGDAVRDIRVGDRVVVPFQISCGNCRECRRGVTGSCGSVPLMAMYGMAPLAGLDGGGFMADLVLVPYADAMLIPIPRRSIPWRSRRSPTTSPMVGARSARSDRSSRGSTTVTAACSWSADCRSCVRRRAGVGDRRSRRLRRHQPEPAGGRREAGAVAHDLASPTVLGPVSSDRAHLGRPSAVAATLRATWADGVCTDTGSTTRARSRCRCCRCTPAGVRFVTGRVNARAVIPEILELLAAGCDLAPTVERVVSGRRTLCLAGDDGQDRLHPPVAASTRTRSCASATAPASPSQGADRRRRNQSILRVRRSGQST